MTACLKCGHDPAAVVLASWTLHVDRDPPSLNSRLHNSGARRWAYKAERNAWQLEVRNVRLLQRLPAATGKRRVTLTRVYGGRQQERDQDNLVGGMKCVVDALVLEGLLVGDGQVELELHATQRRGEPRGLEIAIEVLG